MHNLYFYNNLMTQIREAIDTGSFETFRKSKLEQLEGNGD